ncbi:hypothetical protein [Halomonas getboli]|uniref:hypothetical protein n=1 Tax=Halomonas getboli TaxID=2935862 RepID=UPI001FFF3FFB|nr:hypothetical protein [Halomonas getboli]MCK2183057.1 hypothetical protein [Halomonas getboli]
MNAIGGTFLLLGLSLASFYLFPSGLPQPTDFVLLPFIASMLLVALRDDRGLLHHRFMLAWLALVAWVTLVCLGWVVVYQDRGFLLYLLFVLYNFLLGVSLLRFLMSVPSALALIRGGLVIALAVAFGGVALDLLLGRVRATGTFNNPNQLAFFSLCSLVILLASFDFRPPLRPLPLIGAACAVGNILAASSLGAMSGLVLVTLGWLVAGMGQLRHLLRIALLVPLLLMAVVGFDAVTGGRIEHNLTARFDRAPEKVDGIYEDRQYQRMVIFPQYNLLGAGEGSRERFAPYGKAEIHSSFGTMLFSYGVPGLALFLTVLALTVWGAPPHAWLMLAGPMLYSVTHNGLRTTVFWLMLVVLWYCLHRPVDQAGHVANVGRPWREGRA